MAGPPAQDRPRLLSGDRPTGPLHLGHLRVLTALAEMGAIIMPPMPAFYNRPKQIEDLVDHTLARVLDRLGLPQELVAEWQGTNRRTDPPRPG